MMREKVRYFLFIAVCFLFSGISYSQDDTLQTEKPDTLRILPDHTPGIQKIAVFAPLYLDSAFDAEYNYRYDQSFPKFFNPGLEFYEGVQLALDSLNREKTQLEVFIYDTKSVRKTIRQQVEDMDSVQLIIAYASAQENQYLAWAAVQRGIPFINVNLPNDAGITNNPYFVVLNPTLKTHVEAVYRYLQQHDPLFPVTVLRKRGQMEDMIRAMLDSAGKQTASVPLKLNYTDLPSNFDSTTLMKYLDKDRVTTILTASLDDRFNRRLLTQLSLISQTYPVRVIGMPTLDNLSKEFDSIEYRGIEVIYGNPFYHNRTDSLSTAITDFFNESIYARPSDMVFRGYEVMWKFGKLLLQYKSDLSSNLQAPAFCVFTDFDIRPVINRQTMTLDYFENKKLYFVKWQDGLIKGVE